jgi:hypothetical protein
MLYLNIFPTAFATSVDYTGGVQLELRIFWELLRNNKNKS